MNALGQMLGAALPVLAFQRYDDARVGGWLFAAYGLGGVIGTVVAYKLVTRVPALTLASFAAIGFALPLWVLVPHVALAPILGALAFTALCQPLLNAPMFGVITTRTPSALLPKVMTAIITLATIAGPLGVLVAGALLEHEGLMVTFGVIAGGVTIVALLFVGILTRFRRRELSGGSRDVLAAFQREHVCVRLGHAPARQRLVFAAARSALYTAVEFRSASLGRPAVSTMSTPAATACTAASGVDRKCVTPGVFRSSVITSPLKPRSCLSTLVTTRGEHAAGSRSPSAG